MATEPIPTAEALTQRAIEYTDIDSYDPENTRYHNPLKHVTDGKHHNWASASSGFIPANTINFILSFEDIAEGVATVAEGAVQEFKLWDDSDIGVSDKERIGVILEIAERFGRGAAAERRAVDRVAEKESVRNPVEGDENSKIDIRSVESLFQVKLSAEYRSGWLQKTPTPNIDGDEKRRATILWVKPSGEILIMDDMDETGASRFNPY